VFCCNHVYRYNDRLKAAVQKKVAGEVSGDRRVRPQPLCMRDGCSIFQAKKGADSVNKRRCRELGHHMLAAGMLCEAADELCSFEGICARMMCGEELTLNQQLRTLALRLQEQVRQCDVRAWHQLQRVEHYARWLQRDITTIALDPQTQIFVTCSRQPEISLARKELLMYMQLTSSSVLSSKHKLSCHRSFLLGLSSQEFDACVSELKYHKQHVNCVAYNSNSSMLASASSDHTVGVWNVSTGTLEGVMKGHTGWVSSVAWAPDCRHVITGSHDQTAKIWDTLTLKEIASLHHLQQSYVNCVDWSPKGSYVASGCSAGKKSATSNIKLWDAKHFNCKGTLSGHTDDVVSVAFDCTERLLASSSRDMTIRVWNVQSLQQVAVLLGHTGVVTAVAFDPFARYIASCSHDMTVRIWDALRYEELATLTGHTEQVRCISWDRSGRYVASGAGIDRTPCFDTTIRVWDVHARKNVTTLTGCKYNVNTVSFDCTGEVHRLGLQR
jgi:WD40 repeat protein